MTATATAPAIPTPPALRARDAAAYLGVSLAQLRRYRREGIGPQGRLVGGLLYYPITELDAWMLGELTDAVPDQAGGEN